MDMMDKLYQTSGSEEKQYFKDMYKFEGDKYPHAKEVLIASVKSNEGAFIDVYTMRWPAQFWVFEIDGKFRITTGSGHWDNFKPLFEMLKSDMIGVEVKP